MTGLSGIRSIGNQLSTFRGELFLSRALHQIPYEAFLRVLRAGESPELVLVPVDSSLAGLPTKRAQLLPEAVKHLTYHRCAI
jgi:hypothetical protein